MVGRANKEATINWRRWDSRQTEKGLFMSCANNCYFFHNIKPCIEVSDISSTKCYHFPKISHSGCRHSSMDSSAPSTLPPQVQVPSTPTTLFQFIKVQIVYLSLELVCEKNKNK